MRTLVIYDNNGYIISQISGSVREPVGIPFLWIDIPEGKRIKIIDGIGVDTTVEPHQVVLEDIPLTEIQMLKNQVDALNIAMANLLGV